MTNTIGLAIESLVAILLVLTIAYCVMLNKRLTRLKADEQSLKATISELITVTEIAERAIGGLKLTVKEVNENLGAQLNSAQMASDKLTKQLAEGDRVVRQLSRIVGAARPSTSTEAEAPRATSAKATAAAAQAFAERRKLGGLAA